MELKEIDETLDPANPPNSESAWELLENSVSAFATDPAAATGAICGLQANDPLGFAFGGVRLLASAETLSPGLKYIAKLISASNLSVYSLLDQRVLTMEKALALARNLAAVDPLLDVGLMRKMLADCGGQVRAIPSALALRVLGLLEVMSDGSRLTSYFVQIMRHPSAEVRSKAALLMGRANLNLARTKAFLESDDGRLSANAVESLWSHSASQVKPVLLNASKDPRGRVALNALVGLCRSGDAAAPDRLMQMTKSENNVVRSGAAWAMGESGNAGFAAALERLEKDPDDKVRAMAARSLRKLPVVEAAPENPPPPPAPAGEPEPPDTGEPTA
jgi:hypothetical protein